MSSSNLHEIGGFLAFDCNFNNIKINNSELFFNSGRSAFSFYLKHLFPFKEIAVPFYTCPVVWKTIIECGITPYGYELNKNLEPVSPKKNCPILLTNYFGIKTYFIKKRLSDFFYPIVDNCQAFFCEDLGVPSFSSPRKFFPLPDGGVLSSVPFCSAYSALKEKITELNDVEHIVFRTTKSAAEGYRYYQDNENKIDNSQILKMSRYSLGVLSFLDLNMVIRRRFENFFYLHTYLKQSNQLKICLNTWDVPLAYPYLCKDKNLRNRFIEKKIYVPFFWKSDGQSECMKSLDSTYLSEHLLPLPIDQRYGQNDMTKILEVINEAN